MHSNLSEWLDGLGLGDFAASFESNGVDWDLLPELTNEDLKDLGVSRLADRRALLKAIAALSPSPHDETVPMAERRQLTVAFVDLVGSTALSSTLDPEDYHDVLRAYQEACSSVVARYQGHVARLLGDGILIYFGYPRAHEDDAKRAVLASLGALEAIARLTPLPGLTLQARVGIATGIVVVADIVSDQMSEEGVISGDTPNLAARLQTLAEPGTVVLAEGTRRLAAEMFLYDDLGLHDLRGIAKPVRAWRAIEERVVESHFETARSKRKTAVVDRDEELERLQQRWQRAVADEGQVVMISGEPGIGKSHLAYAFCENLTSRSNALLRFYCSPYHQHSALFPVISHFDRAAGFTRNDPPEVKLDKLEALLRRSAENALEIAPLIAALLSIPAAERYTAMDLSPRRQKDMTLAALGALLEGVARQGPVLLIFEDLHWIDPTTLEFLGQIVERVQRLPVLLLVTFRPDFSCPWISAAHVTTLILSRLSETKARSVVVKLCNGTPLHDQVVSEIVLRSDGVPLYLEELTKSMLELGAAEDRNASTSASRAVEVKQVPTSLYDSLMARLDRLTSARETVHLAAVLGRSFTYPQLAAVSSLSGQDLQQALHELDVAELVLSSGRPPEVRYQFKHSLIQEIAYQSLVRPRRADYHRRIAAAFEQQFQEIVDTQPEIIARHYSEAGEAAKAIPYWEQAGAQAARRSANIEAIAHFRKGLQQVAQLPDGNGKIELELSLLLPLGAQLLAVHGFGAGEVEKTYARAMELCRGNPDSPKLLPVYWGLWGYYVLRANLSNAAKLGDQFLSLATRLKEPIAQVAARYALGVTAFYCGELRQSLEHFEAGLGHYAPSQQQSHQLLYGQDLAMGFHSYQSWALSLMGRPEQAEAMSRRALIMAEEANHAFSLAYAQIFAAQMHHFLGNAEAAEGYAQSAATLSKERGFAQWEGQAIVQLGRAWDRAGDSRGFSVIRQGWEAYRATGAALAGPYASAWLAEAHERRNEIDEGLSVIGETLDLNRDNGERYYDPELLRVKGELLLMTGDSHEQTALACFREAAAMARRQGAKTLQLRSETSLCRLLMRQGEVSEARSMLLETYESFREGFETKDLVEARDLLSAIESSR